ncbi:MAG: CopD family protein [Niabella sp.]
MAYLYIKAVHVILVVTWFAGLFYMPRLLIYNVEANDKPKEVKEALQSQFGIMMKRLWYGITWPSAILTLIFGLTILLKGGWIAILFKKEGLWLLLKLVLVLFLYVYHFATHIIFKQQLKGIFKLSSQQLRMWNEIATIFLISIVMLVVVKQSISVVWGFVGIITLVALLLTAIKIYKKIRKE